MMSRVHTVVGLAIAAADEPVRLIARVLATAGPLMALATTPANAATFTSPTPVTGVGDEPALAQIVGASLTADGGALLAGSSDNAGRRRAFTAFAEPGSSSVAARRAGPPSGAYDLAWAANAQGAGALAYTVGHVAYLTMCVRERCRPTLRVGSSALKPQAAVAVQPRTGRTILLWRGRTRSGSNRLLWRITTKGRLGATHTLGEFGDAPRLATDASGKTVAVWLADRRAGRRGIRTAARRVGEFLAPTTVSRSPASGLRLVTSDHGDSVAAWLTAPNGVDPSQPVGQVQVARRGTSTRFGAPRSLGSASTLSLAGARDGHAVIAVDRHVAGTSVVVSAARARPGGEFEPLADVSSPQFVSDAYGASAAIGAGGRALVSWAAGADPSTGSRAGIFATLAEPSAPFGPAQQLADAQTATLPQPTAAAVTPTAGLVAWTGPRGGQLAREGW